MEYHYAALANALAAWAALCVGLCEKSWKSAALRGLFCFAVVMAIFILAGWFPASRAQGPEYELLERIVQTLAAIALGLGGHAVRRALIWLFQRFRRRHAATPAQSRDLAVSAD